jgi:EmrB/QacA subfamily drug resistance transporter
MQFMAVVDGTVGTLALPPLQRDLGLSDGAKTWVVTAYAIAFGGLMLLGGRLGDTFGRKRMFLGGVALFALSSLACGLAVNGIMLIGSRFLQGAGAAVAAPTAMALVASTYPIGPKRNRAVAIFGAMTGVGSIAGLIIGGALTDISWRLIFLINVPIGLAIVIAGIKVLGESAGDRLSLDVAGAIFATGGAFCLVLAFSEGPAWGWGSPWILTSFALAFVLLAAFLLVERRAANPLLPFSLFHVPSRVATFVTIFFAGAVMMSTAVFVASFVQQILGYSPLVAGLGFLPFAVGMGLASALVSRLAPKIAPRWLIVIGTLMMAAGLAYGSTLDGTARYWQNLFATVFLVGFGVGLAMIPLPLCAVAGVSDTEIGPVSAVAQMLQNLSGPIVLVVLGAMATSKTLSLGGVSGSKIAEMNSTQLWALGEGYTFALLGCGAVALIGTVMALFIRFTPAQVAQAQEAEKAAKEAGAL